MSVLAVDIVFSLWQSAGLLPLRATLEAGDAHDCALEPGCRKGSAAGRAHEWHQVELLGVLSAACRF